MRRKYQTATASRAVATSLGAPTINSNLYSKQADQQQQQSTRHPIYASGVNAEWENLLAVFCSKKSREHLNQLADVACALRDTSTHQWQRRQHAIKSIPSIMNDAVEFVYCDANLIDEVLKNSPSMPGQIALRSHQVGDSRAQNSSFSQQTNFQGQGSSNKANSVMSSTGTRRSPQNRAVDRDMVRKNIKFCVVSWMLRIVQPFLITQLSDLRISIVREACLIILWMARQFPDEFYTNKQKMIYGGGAASRTHDTPTPGSTPEALLGGNGVGYLKDDALPRLLQTGNKLFQELGHLTIKELLSESASSTMDKLIQHLCPLLNSRDAQVRLWVTEYFEQVLKNALSSSGTETKALVHRHVDLIEFALLKCSEDINSEVRQQSIQCASLYYKLQPKRCQELVRYAMTPNHVKRSLLIALKIEDDDNQDVSSAGTMGRAAQNLLVDQLRDADKLSLDGDSKLEIKLNVVRGINSQALKTKQLKERFDVARTAQDFDKILGGAQSQDEANLHTGRSTTAEERKNERRKVGKTDGGAKPYQMLTGPKSKVSKQRFSLFDEYKKNQFSPKAQTRIAQLQQFKIQTNKPPRQSPPAVLQQKSRYLEMTQSMSQKRATVAVRAGKYGHGRMSQQSIGSGHSGNNQSLKSGSQRSNKYYPDEYSAQPSKPSMNANNESQMNQQINPNRMFAQVQKLYKEIKRDQSNLKKHQGIRSFSNLKKSKDGGRNHLLDMDGKGGVGGLAPGIPTQNQSLDPLRNGSVHSKRSAGDQPDQSDQMRKIEKSVDSRNSGPKVGLWKRNDSQSNMSEKSRSRQSTRNNKALNAETVQKYDKYLSQFQGQVEPTILSRPLQKYEAQTARMARRSSALAQFMQKKPPLQESRSGTTERTAAATGEKSQETMERLKATNFYHQALQNKLSGNSSGTILNTNSGRRTGLSNKDAHGMEDSSSSPSPSPLKFKEDKNQLALRNPQAAMLDKMRKSPYSGQKMSLSLNVALHRLNAPSSKSSSPPRQKGGLPAPPIVNLMVGERRQRSRDGNSTAKDESIATTTTQMTRRLKKDRMKKRTAPLADTQAVHSEEEKRKNTPRNSNDDNEVPAIIYQVMEPKKDRYGNQGNHKKNDNEGSGQQWIDKVRPGAGRGGRFSWNAESTPKREGQQQRRVARLEKGQETDVVAEVKAGKESEQSHVSSIGAAGDRANEYQGSGAQPRRKNLTLSKDICFTDATSKELRDLLQLAHADQSTEKIEDFRESSKDMEGEDFAADDMEQPIPNALLPVQHPAPHPFGVHPQDRPQTKLPQTTSAATLQSCNVASQAEEHKKIEDSDESSGEISQLTEENSAEEEAVDENNQGSCLEQGYALELSKKAVQEMDDRCQTSDYLREEAVNDQYGSSDEEDLIINLEAVKIESVIELERLDDVEHHRSIDRVSDYHTSNDDAADPAAIQNRRIQQSEADELKRQLNLQGDTNERDLHSKRVDDDANYSHRTKSNQGIIGGDCGRPNREKQDQKDDQIVIIDNLFDTDDLLSSKPHTQISHQLSQIEEVSCAEQTEEKTEEKTEERLSTRERLSTKEERLSTKEAQSNKTAILNDEASASQNQSATSSEYSDYGDYVMELYRVHCNEYYNPVMEHVLGSFNTEEPIEGCELDYLNEKVEISCDEDEDYGAEVEDDGKLDYDIKYQQQSYPSNSSKANARAKPSSSPESNESQHTIQNLKVKYNNRQTSELPPSATKKIDELSLTDYNTTSRGNQEMNIISCSTPKLQPSESQGNTVSWFKEADQVGKETGKTTSKQSNDHKQPKEWRVAERETQKQQESHQPLETEEEGRLPSEQDENEVQEPPGHLSHRMLASNANQTHSESVSQSSKQDSIDLNEEQPQIQQNEEEMFQKIDSQIQRRQRELELMSQKNERKALEVLPSTQDTKQTLKKTFNGLQEKDNSMVEDRRDKKPHRPLTSKTISRKGQKGFSQGHPTEQSSINDQKLFWNLVCEADQSNGTSSQPYSVE